MSRWESLLAVQAHDTRADQLARRLDTLPEHLIVVGSGVTGAEFVNAYTELGVKVTVVASRDQILPHEDSDAAAVLVQRYYDQPRAHAAVPLA